MNGIAPMRPLVTAAPSSGKTGRLTMDSVCNGVSSRFTIFRIASTTCLRSGRVIKIKVATAGTTAADRNWSQKENCGQ